MRILIVDDEPIIRSLLLSSLEPLGHEMFEADNGISGLSRAEQFHPGIILLDVTMPGINGLEVLRRLRQSGTVFRPRSCPP
jgi:two-component system, OmpR family, response regulator